MHPIPTTIFWGIIFAISIFFLLEIKTRPSGFSFSIFSGTFIQTSFPATIRLVTFLADSKLSSFPFIFKAIVSTAIFPETSEAVEITGTAPVISPKIFAASFAPPRCPERREIIKFPSSSIVRTAGSISFDFIKGAIVRTAIPEAVIKRKVSYFKIFFSKKF